MECGCTRKKEELIKKNTTYKCPEHPKNQIKKIIRKCLDCPEVLELKPNQSSVIRCPVCAVKIKQTRKRLKRAQQPKPVKKEEPVKMDVSLYAQGLSRYLPEKEKKCA